MSKEEKLKLVGVVWEDTAYLCHEQSWHLEEDIVELADNKVWINTSFDYIIYYNYGRCRHHWNIRFNPIKLHPYEFTSS